MGFDIVIQLTLTMCEETGKPYYLSYDKEKNLLEKIYGVPDVEVPEHLRKYLRGKGHFYHIYTGYFEENDSRTVPVEEFLEQYPKWEEVKKYEEYHEEIRSCWSFEDHKNFKDLLQWCNEAGPSFEVCWY